MRLKELFCSKSSSAEKKFRVRKKFFFIFVFVVIAPYEKLFKTDFFWPGVWMSFPVRMRVCMYVSARVCVWEREDRSSCLFCYVFGHVYHDYSMQLLMQQTPVDEKFPQSCCSGFFRANSGSCSLNSGPKSCPCCHGKNFYGKLRRKTTRFFGDTMFLRNNLGQLAHSRQMLALLT